MQLAQAVVAGTLTGCIYALIAVSLTLIWGVMDLVNFAHGNLVMLAMYLTYFGWAAFSADALLSIPVVMAAMALVCAAVFYIFIRPVLRGTLLSQMLVTFGLLMLLQGGAQLFFTARARSIPHPFSASLTFDVASVVVGGPQLVAATGALVGLLALQWTMTRTELGLALSAVAQDRDAAQLMGINPDKMFAVAWAMTGALIGVAGALLMNYFSVDPFASFTLGLIAFVCVALGGFGSISGSFLAAMLMGLTQNIVGLFAPAYGYAAIFGAFLLLTYVRPQGLLGTR